MTQKFTPLKTLLLCGISFLAVLPATLFAQPDYIFRNPVLISGSSLQVGAKYRFSNVKTGIDGIIEIKSMQNGITLQTLDGGSGFDAAFQPAVTAPSGRNGYVEFQLDLVVAGTMTNVRVAELPMTAIDIDGSTNGSGRVYEFDQFAHGSQYRTMYEMVGSSLSIQEAAGWTTVRNATGVDYPGIDTVQKDVMFTAIYNDVDRVVFRVGADNRSNAQVNRLRSVYFKKFNYATGILPVGSLLSFGGYADGAGVQLQWQLAAGCKPGTITIERSMDGNKFSALTARNVQTSSGIQKDSYMDMVNTQGAVFYRLRLETLTGQTEYSRVLIIRQQGSSQSSLKLYPTLVRDNAVLRFTASTSATATIQVMDMNGRAMQSQQFSAGQGANTVQLDGLERLGAGIYVVSLSVGQEKMIQRFVKQ